MGETQTGRYKIDDAQSKRTNKSDKSVERNTYCPSCGHKKGFRKGGKIRCTRCKRFY